MNLNEALNADAARRRRECLIAKLSRPLSAEDQATLAAALGNPGVSSRAISRALGLMGVSVSSHTVDKHRRGDCGCRSETT